MFTQEMNIGRVIRVGRRWADVLVDGKLRRITIRPDLLIRAGSYLQISGDQVIGLLPSNPHHSTDRVQ
jgi:hypothetical protein